MPVDQAVEPTPKRQRLDDAQHKQSQPPEIEIGLGPLIAHNLTDRPCNLDGANLHSSPNSGGDCGSFQSPAAGSWTQDGFSQDPDFLASQEELRCFLFSLANSAVPTRASSPDAAGSGDHLEQLSQPLPKDSRDSWHAPLSEGRHIQYLKNYVTEVAPWVCRSFFCPLITRTSLAQSWPC